MKILDKKKKNTQRILRCNLRFLSAQWYCKYERALNEYKKKKKKKASEFGFIAFDKQKPWAISPHWTAVDGEETIFILQ